METLHTFINLDNSGFDIAETIKHGFVLPLNVYKAIQEEFANTTDFNNCCKYAIHITSKNNNTELKGMRYKRYKDFLINKGLVKLTRTHACYENFSRVAIHEFEGASSLILDFQRKDNSDEYFINAKLNEKQENVLKYSMIDINKLYEYCLLNHKNITDTCDLINKALEFNSEKRFAKKGIKVSRLYSSLTALNKEVRKFLYIQINDTKHFFSNYDIKTSQAKMIALKMHELGLEIDKNYIEDCFLTDFYATLNRRMIEQGYTKLTTNAPIELDNGRQVTKLHLSLVPQFRSIIKQPIISEVFFGNKNVINDAANGGRYVISTVFKNMYPKVYKFITDYRSLCSVENKRICSSDILFNEYKRNKQKTKLKTRYNEIKTTMAADFQSFEASVVLEDIPDAYMFTVHDCIYFIDLEKEKMFEYLNRIYYRFLPLDERLRIKHIFDYEPAITLEEEYQDPDWNSRTASFYTDDIKIRKQHKKHLSKIDTLMIKTIEDLIKTNLPKSQIAKQLNISRPTLLKYIHLIASTK